jgi:hypothetical protein
MIKSRRNIIIILIIVLLLGVGSFVVLQFYNPFRTYPSSSKESKQYTIDEILLPSCPQINILSKNGVIIDTTNSKDGYVCAKGPSDGIKKKVQVIQGDLTYTYDLFEDAFTILPLMSGSGDYKIRSLKQKEDTAYSVTASLELSVTLDDELSIYLYPNQIVDYDQDTLVVILSFELTKESKTQLQRVHDIYQWIVTNIDYDYDKVEEALSTFMIPDLDLAYTKRKGICFDYAALMTAMLRVQHIPTRLITGYTDPGYHAWVETYIDGVGWINPSIYFENETWKRLDPTFDAQGPYFGKYQKKLTY